MRHNKLLTYEKSALWAVVNKFFLHLKPDFPSLIFYCQMQKSFLQKMHCQKVFLLNFPMQHIKGHFQKL